MPAEKLLQLHIHLHLIWAVTTADTRIQSYGGSNVFLRTYMLFNEMQLKYQIHQMSLLTIGKFSPNSMKCRF